MRLKIVSIKKNGNEKNIDLFFLTYFFIFQHIPTHVISSRLCEPTPKHVKCRYHRAQQQNLFKKKSELIENIHQKKVRKIYTFQYTNFFSFILLLTQLIARKADNLLTLVGFACIIT